MTPDTVPWDELCPGFLASWGWPGGRWEPEHLGIYGPTGSGKSLFMMTIITERSKASGAHAVVLATKPADKTMTGFTKDGWKIRRTWPPDYGEDRVVYWPPGASMAGGLVKQRKAIQDFLISLWKPKSNIILAFDEIAYVEIELGLKRMIEQYWREARSIGVTLCATTQRPRHVSRQMHSQSTWSISFRPDDEDDAKRVAEILGSRREYTPLLLELEPYQFVMVRRRTREAYISRIG